MKGAATDAQMDTAGVQDLLDKKIEELRRQSYAELCRFLRPQSVAAIGRSVHVYQTDVGAAWEDQSKQHLRVTGSITPRIATGFMMTPGGARGGDWGESS